MKQISINGTARTELGKKAAKAIRNSGNVPCVLYGEKKDANGQPEAIHFSVSEKEINKLIYTPHIYLVDINIDGEDHKGILKEVQFHPVKDNVLHVDFLEVHAEKPIVMGPPLRKPRARHSEGSYRLHREDDPCRYGCCRCSCQGIMI